MVNYGRNKNVLAGKNFEKLISGGMSIRHQRVRTKRN